MLSFADYRKEQLKETINEVCVEEGVKKHFEILRLELLEAIKLPQILSEGAGMAEQAEYNLFVEEDFHYNRAFIEELIHLHKLHFHDELMMEADMAAASPMANMDNFKAKLVEEVKRMMAELRNQISAILNPETDAGSMASTSHDGGSAESPAVDAPTPAAAHSSGNGSAGGGGAPMGSASGDNLQVGDAAAAAGGGNDPYPRWSAYRGEERPEQGGFQPAAYGNKTPTGGIRGGLSRLWRRMTRPVRRIWHGDPTREMGKHMKRESVEQIITENWDQIEPLLVDFEKNMLKYIDTSFANIGMPGAPSVPSSSEELGNDPEIKIGDAVPDEEVPGDAVNAIPLGATDTAIPDDSVPGEVDQERAAAPTYKRSGPMSKKGYRKSVRNAGIEALGTTKAESGHAANPPHILGKLRDKLELRQGIAKNDPQLGQLINDYYKMNKTKQKGQMKAIATHLGATTPSGGPSHMVLGSMLLQQVGRIASPDLHMPDNNAPMEPSGLPEDPNGEAAGAVRDENPDFVAPQQSTRSGSEIDPAVAAAENPAGHITAQDASQEAIPDEEVEPKRKVTQKEIGSIYNALVNNDLLDTFMQKFDIGLPNIFGPSDGADRQDMIKKNTGETLKGLLISNPELDAEGLIAHIAKMKGGGEGEQQVGGGEGEQQVGPAAQVDPAAQRAAEKEQANKLSPEEKRAKIDALTASQQQDAANPQASVDDGLAVDPAAVDPAADGLGLNVDDLANKLGEFEDKLGGYDPYSVSAAMMDAADGDMETLSRWIKTIIADNWDEVHQELADLRIEPSDQKYYQNPDDDIEYNDNGEVVGESFSHKVNRLKKQLRESTKMGKSKYKKQRETILG